MYACECEDGWTNAGDDVTAQCSQRQCSSSLVCQNGGICVPAAGTIPEHCVCEPGYTGDVCQSKIPLHMCKLRK